MFEILERKPKNITFPKTLKKGIKTLLPLVVVWERKTFPGKENVEEKLQYRPNTIIQGSHLTGENRSEKKFNRSKTS
jgi:hypothetical protein